MPEKFYPRVIQTTHQAIQLRSKHMFHILVQLKGSLHLMAHNYDILNAPELANDSRIILTSNYPTYSQNYSLKD